MGPANSARLVRIAAALGLAAVALGAFGAHGLRARLGAGGAEVWRTAVLYHLVHSVALLAVALGADRVARARVVGALWCAGVILFSGSLYLLALDGPRWLGPITPLGGLAFLAGWLLLALGVRR